MNFANGKRFCTMIMPTEDHTFHMYLTLETKLQKQDALCTQEL